MEDIINVHKNTLDNMIKQCEEAMKEAEHEMTEEYLRGLRDAYKSLLLLAD